MWGGDGTDASRSGSGEILLQHYHLCQRINPQKERKVKKYNTLGHYYHYLLSTKGNMAPLMLHI